MPFWRRKKPGENVATAQPPAAQQTALSPEKTKSIGDVLLEAKLPRHAHMARFAE